MKTLYIECKMGVAGDMLAAALIDLCDDKDNILKELNSMGLSGVTFSLDKSVKCGITGKHLKVLVDGFEEESHDHDHDHNDHKHDHHHDHDHEDEHHHDHNHHHFHMHMSDIENIIASLKVDDYVKKDVLNIYKIIAEAESRVHDTPVTDIHFHEVGRMDAIADITASCLIINKLKPVRICVSPINVGSGQVKCAHGILPVPAPATALILQNIPFYSSDIKGELCTPTGAAVIKYFAHSYGNQPVMMVDKIGYGMGKKDFPQANLVRTMLGESDGLSEKSGEEALDKKAHFHNNDTLKETHRDDNAMDYVPKSDTFNNDNTDSIIELVCNLDDMTGEELGFATEQILMLGAVDVFTTPIYMKKNRPAVLLTVLCHEDKRQDMVKAIFKYTTTIGIRESICNRYILTRENSVLKTRYGDVNVKNVNGYGISRSKREYDDLAKIARENDISLRDIQ